MLCARRGSDNKKVFAHESKKEDSPFYCLSCNNELVLKKGRIKIHHFSHKNICSCPRGQGESEAHRECKLEIYHELSKSNGITGLDVEVNLGSAVADIFFYIDEKPVAIEVQRSNLSVNEISRRTKIYAQLKIHVLWLALLNENHADVNKYAPKAWEKWCHALYYGRVYYWLEGLDIRPFHFGECMRYIEESHWYEEGGEERCAGGYFKTYKLYKTIILGQKINLINDFVCSFKPAWQSEKTHIPDCFIYRDNLTKWW